MCVCVCVCVCVCICVYLYIFIYMYVFVHVLYARVQCVKRLDESLKYLLLLYIFTLLVSLPF